MTFRVFLGLGEFEGVQDLVACCDSVRKAFQPGSEPFKFVPAEVTVTGAGGKDQKVVPHGHVQPVRVGYEDTFLVLVHICDLSQDHGRVFLLPENRTDWKANLTGRQNRRRDLVEQRLKQVVIRTIDQENLCWCLAESLGGRQPTKPSTNNDDSWLSQACRHSPRCFISDGDKWVRVL
jgi:hypothetical protein